MQENEIVYLTSNDAQHHLARLLANHSSANRLLISLHPLRTQLESVLDATSGSSAPLSQSPRPSSSSSAATFDPNSNRHKANRSEASGSWLVLCPKVQPPSDFFQFFQVELQKANVQSKHRLMALLADRMLNALSSSSASPSAVPSTRDELTESDRTKFSAPDPGFDLAGEYALQAHSPLSRARARSLVTNQTLFHVPPSLQVLPVIQAVWALGFTLQQLVRQTCDHDSTGSSPTLNFTFF
jgi:hypothetical protein